MKFFHPPNLYCVTTLPSKTNTTANIGANSWTGILQSQRYGGEDDSGAKVYSSYYCCIVLEKGLLPDIRAICQSLQVAIAAGWSASAHRPDNDGLPEKKSTSTSLNLQIALILIPRITLFGVLFSNESTTNDNSRRWKNWSER